MYISKHALVASMYVCVKNSAVVSFAATPSTQQRNRDQRHHRMLEKQSNKRSSSIKEIPALTSELRQRHRKLDGPKTQIGKDAYSHLLEITKDRNGKPNPRNTCTDGYKYAADYVASQMRDIGLEPLGDDDGSGGKSYVQVLENSVDEALCPDGIRNVIGFVQGTTFPDEYIMYAAHLDGPNNMNPQTQKNYGNENVANAYDNGLAVAVGLAIAKKMIENPPSRSTIFLMDAAEEGFNNMLPPALGEDNSAVCSKIEDTEWFSDVNSAIGFPTPYKCEKCCIGAHAWTSKPTVDLENVKFVMNVDPLGAPHAQSNLLAALGGERSYYGTNKTKTLNHFLDEIWPDDSDVILVKAPRAAVNTLASTYDAFTTRYGSSCGNNCVAAGGIPSVWIAQPAFQKFHGGVLAESIKDLFGTLDRTLNMFDNDGVFSSTFYFSVDDLTAFYLPALDGMATTLADLLANAANSDSVNTLAYDKDKDSSITNSDIENLMNGLDASIVQLNQLPAPAQDEFNGAITIARNYAELLKTPYFEDNQEMMSQLSQALIGLLLASDFFNDNYPGKQEFWDQTYGPPPNKISHIGPRQSPPSNTHSASSYTSVYFVMFLTTSFAAVVSTAILIL